MTKDLSTSPGPVRRGYRPARPGSFIWWWAALITRPFVRRAPSVTSGERSAKEVSDSAIAMALGADPDLEQREDLLGILTNSALILGGSILVLTTLVGIAFDAVTGHGSGLIFARTCGALLAAPLLALCLVWSCRWTIARRDLARRRAPSPGSQPATRDLVYAAPLAALLALFFAFV